MILPVHLRANSGVPTRMTFLLPILAWIYVYDNSGCRPACRDRPRVCPTGHQAGFMYNCSGIERWHVYTVLADGRTDGWTGADEQMDGADRHGVCPYMRAKRPNWRGGGRGESSPGISTPIQSIARNNFCRRRILFPEPESSFGYRNTLRQEFRSPFCCNRTLFPEPRSPFPSIIYYFESQKVFWCRNTLQQEPRNHFWCRRTLFRDLNSFPAPAEHYAKT